MSILDELRDETRRFSEDRGWILFHTPKNVAMAIAGEAGELAALFQWLTPEESYLVDGYEDERIAVQHEMADVLIYLLRLSDVLDVDLAGAVRAKLAINESRFPATEHREHLD